LAIKLDLDQKLIDLCRTYTADIADDIEDKIAQNTTTSVERTVLRLLGVDGVDEHGIPLPNVIVEKVQKEGKLHRGISYWFGNALLQTELEVQELAQAIAEDEVDLFALAQPGNEKVYKHLLKLARAKADEIRENVKTRKEMKDEHPPGPKPWLYVIVATGNIYEDVKQAKAAARQGADIIAVIRSTAQSLLDYVPYGPTTEGFGGTYATQANFKIMREALDEVSKEEARKYLTDESYNYVHSDPERDNVMQRLRTATNKFGERKYGELGVQIYEDMEDRIDTSVGRLIEKGILDGDQISTVTSGFDENTLDPARVTYDEDGRAVIHINHDYVTREVMQEAERLQEEQHMSQPEALSAAKSRIQDRLEYDVLIHETRHREAKERRDEFIKRANRQDEFRDLSEISDRDKYCAMEEAYASSEFKPEGMEDDGEWSEFQKKRRKAREETLDSYLESMKEAVERGDITSFTNTDLSTAAALAAEEEKTLDIKGEMGKIRKFFEQEIKGGAGWEIFQNCFDAYSQTYDEFGSMEGGG